jgi:hypothetical protein
VAAGVRCKIELLPAPPSLQIDRSIPQVSPDGAR